MIHGSGQVDPNGHDDVMRMRRPRVGIPQRFLKRSSSLSIQTISLNSLITLGGNAESTARP